MKFNKKLLDELIAELVGGINSEDDVKKYIDYVASLSVFQLREPRFIYLKQLYLDNNIDGLNYFKEKLLKDYIK